MQFERYQGKEVYSDFIPEKKVVNILITSGASCPDAVVEEVIEKILVYFSDINGVDTVIESIKETFEIA